MDSESALTQVHWAMVHNGRIFASQMYERGVRVFTVEGDFVDFLGGLGQGPGEFQALGSGGWDGDLLWMSDPTARRVSYFDAELRFLSSQPILPHPTLPSGFPWVLAVLKDGSMLVQFDKSATEVASAPSKPGHMPRLGPEGVLLDTATVTLGRRGVFMLAEGLRHGVQWSFSLPVADRSLVSAARDGSGFLVVHRQTANQPGPHTYKVVRFDGRADTLWVQERQYDPIPVSDEWRLSQVNQWMESISDDPNVVSPARSRSAFEAVFDAFEFFPAVESAFFGEAGTTWLQLRTGVASFQWAVLDTTGLHIGWFEPPPNSTLVWPGIETVWFTETDQLGVPFLVGYRVLKP